MSHSVALLPHDPEWASHAAVEIARLMTALTPAILSIEHVGSTSIPAICAKPTIDLLPVARSLTALDATRDIFESLGYVWRGAFGLPRRRFCVFNGADGRRLFNVHCWPAGDPAIARHLAFRDYLRAHPDEARAYEDEKRRAAAGCGGDPMRYNDLKSAWVLACQARALAWAG